MRRIVVAAILAVSTFAYAGDRSDKVQALMEAQGLVKTFDQQIQAGRERAGANANQMLEQLLAGLKPNEAYQEKFRTAVQEFVEQLQPPWSGKKVVEIWSSIYGAEFTDEELDQLLAYYTSPLAQKEVAVSRASFSKFMAQLQEQYKPIMQRATAAYIERLKAIAAECNCKR